MFLDLICYPKCTCYLTNYISISKKFFFLYNMKTALSLMLVLLMFGVFAERVQGGVTIYVADSADGNNLDFWFNGTLDIDGMTSNTPSTAGWADVYFSNGNSMTLFAQDSANVKRVTHAFLVIANPWFASSLSGGYNVDHYVGDTLGVQYSDHSIILPLNYISGDLLSGSGTILGLTLADVKFFDGWAGSPTSGTLATMLSGDTIDLVIVPEPMTAMLWVGGVVLFLFVVRRRRSTL